MNIKRISEALWKYKAIQGSYPIPKEWCGQELDIAKNKLNEMIKHNPQLEPFRDMEITDEMVIDIISQFFNDGGWDHMQVLQWLKRHDPRIKTEFEWDQTAVRVVAQLVHEPEKLKQCSKYLGVIE